ncbi:MAG TPA: alginate export family protein [Puia sp.]|nr:alginate export family protein [Puia sp.]
MISVLRYPGIGAVLIGSVTMLSMSSVRAQSQSPLALSRYNDSFKLLAADSNRLYTLIPGWKAIRLFNNNGDYVGFGGEIREEVNYYNNQNWDATPSGMKTLLANRPFLLHRFMLHTNLVLSPVLRIFAELKSGLASGEAGGPRPQIDVDTLDIHQAFADITLNARHLTTLKIRAGRQEMDYGASRLISENEGPNVRLAFQGVKAMFHAPLVNVDGFYTHPVSNSLGLFDDRPEKPVKLYGFYATLAIPEALDDLFDIYYLGNTNQDAQYIKGSGNENRHSYGARIFSRKNARWTYDVEGTYQDGSFGSERIHAFGIVTRLNYHPVRQNWLEAISLVGQAVSGDRGKPDQLNTFNPLYTRDYYGSGVPYWASDIIQMTPSANLKITREFLLEADVHFLWRDNIHDGLYLVVPTRLPFIHNSTAVSKHRFIGAQQDLDLTYNLTAYWFLDLECTYMPATAYIHDTGYGKNYLFALFQIKFRI